MPRFGNINERRHQLHEVIRLSGINLVINDLDMPLIIKVASIPKERIQVYFIDNDDYFKRKATFTDENGNLFEDNDERAIFFAKGVIETVKKLEKRARQEIIDFSTSNKYNWEIITVEHLGLEDIVDVFPKVIITFQITNQDGSAVLGIISQEEFDERAEPLKKIILD